jgi:hypothetical protein
MYRIYIVLLVLLSIFSIDAYENELPSSSLTPGSSYNRIDLICVCHKGYISHKTISFETRKKVLERYSIPLSWASEYRIDMLIPESLGGTDSLNNLWPLKLKGKWNYEAKRRLEEKLVKLSCDGIIDLTMARFEISTNWVEAYKKYFGDIR